ncbi:MAG: double-strand break repair protein AddB [Xanthobacteraceae bacterium]|nr:double-strand break repair protein AddB [Xanthobacteraceae bacterium]
MTTRSPRVFTVPASAPFVPTLIDALRDGTLVEGFSDTGDPLALASATIYLPTRRACRLARDTFLDVIGADAAILPRIVPIGDIDEDELVFADTANPGALDLKDELGGLERRLLLTQLVSKWAASQAMRRDGNAPLVANNPASALALADALARLMDDMTTRQVPWDKLDTLVPDEHDEYWQLTLRFLNEIVRQAWPLILAERGKIEPAERRDLLIAAEAKRLAAHAGGPVIAAGSTGSMPATATLIETIARLPQGAVVLPGLDTDLDEPAWDDIAGHRDAEGRTIVAPAIGHPQFAMQALLRRIGITRAEVLYLGKPPAHGREAVVSEVMRPAETTDKWHELAERDLNLDEALANVSVIAAANAEEEALAIAVALREALEMPGKTAALVTPDRALARRVLAALARWDVMVDDSGGDALADAPAGVFARLVAEAALEGLEPVTLLALLKHPLFRLGAGTGAHAHAISVIEQALLRGPRPKPGAAGLAHALKTFRDNRDRLHRADPRARLSPGQLQNAADLIDAFAAALKPLEALARTRQPLAVLAETHRQVIDALSRERQGSGVASAGRDGTALDRTFEEIADNAQDAVAVAAADYPDLFRAIAAEKPVRHPDRPGVRVRIYGPLEARLQSIDRVVLGGLVEGVWPPETGSDPWLSRPMRRALGLDLPERRISLSAHDFAQMLGADEVVLAYAAKLAGAPTVPSRFMQRLAAVAGEARWEAAAKRGATYLAWARALDHPPVAARPVPRPEPKPRREARPTSLSVTEIETWLRDPYSIYARHVLNLRPLDPIDTPPGARDRGTVIHGAIEKFGIQFKDTLPVNALSELIRLGEAEFAALEDFPEARAFWWPRFQRIARWFVAFETRRRAAMIGISVEANARLEIPLEGRTFTLRTRADRIEHLRDGRFAILDYKTGRPPTGPQVSSGLTPQLTLEGAILRAGSFEGIPAGASIAELIYVALRGGEPPGNDKAVDLGDSSPDEKADEALRELTKLVTRFEDEEVGYLSRERVMFMRRNPGDYDHLARVKEWSLTSGAAEDGGETE